MPKALPIAALLTVMALSLGRLVEVPEASKAGRAA